jgi:4-amino-4-deoxy-L-arabinose transferase-like glycosyltransferase
VVALALACAVIAYLWSGASRQPWRGDEPHKISETFFLRLLLRHDLDHPAWFGSPIARGNPQFGKVVFGLAVLAGGDSLPENLAIQDALLASGHWTTSEEMRLANQHRLQSARRVSIVSTGIAAALIFLICAEVVGWWGLIAAVIFLRHHIVTVQSTTAVYDALITALVVAALWLFVEAVRARSGRTQAFLAVLCGLTCAAAFQTRLSGLVSWGAIVVAGVVLSCLARSKRFLGWTAIVTVVTFAASVAMNPFYWWPAPGVPGSNEALPARVLSRIAWQLRDLAGLQRGQISEIHSWSERLRFEWQSVSAGFAGKILILGVLAVLVVVIRRRMPSHLSIAVLAGCVALSGALFLWLPMSWDRYLEPAIAGLSIAAGIALGALWSSLSS